MNRTSITFILVITILSLIMTVKYHYDNAPVLKKIDLNSSILAFGDSLTYGYNAKPEYSYPSIIEKKTGIKVINAGVSGEVSSKGLIRLKKYLKSNPDIVILCHGGNDILQHKSRKKLKENLLSMVKLIKENGAEVILVGVPDFNILSFKTLSLYEEVADETDSILEDSVLTYIVLRGELKSDMVHPNESGYELMADKFIKILKENFKL